MPNRMTEGKGGEPDETIADGCVFRHPVPTGNGESPFRRPSGQRRLPGCDVRIGWAGTHNTLMGRMERISRQSRFKLWSCRSS